MNGKKFFAFVGPPGSLHRVVADIVWSGLQVERPGIVGRFDFDLGNKDELHPCSLSEFYQMLGGVARVVPQLSSATHSVVICTGHPNVRIPCVSSYSCDVPLGLAWQCVQSLNAPAPDILFIVDSKDEVLRGRIGASKRDWNNGVLDRIISHYREMKESKTVIRLDSNEGPRAAADMALEHIRKVI